MATIDSRKIIDQLIAGNGRIDPEEAPDNPWATKIIEYTNAYGNVTWGVAFENEGEWGWRRYLEETPYVQRPRVIWERQS